LLTIFGVLQFQRGSNEIKLETRDVVAATRSHHARAALHAATRQTPLALAYGPWTLRGRPCVLGGLRTTHRPCTASRRETRRPDATRRTVSVPTAARARSRPAGRPCRRQMLAISSFSLPHLQRNEASRMVRHLCSADAIAGCRGAPPSACHHRPRTSPEPPHCSTSPSPATSSPPLRARTVEKRLRRPQIHRAAVLHRRSILQPPDCLKWDPR
jgi:hypothetical protein